MRFLKAVQDAVGFTRKEAVSILTLSTIFLVGTGILWLKTKEDRGGEKSGARFDYSEQDSLYQEAVRKHALLPKGPADTATTKGRNILKAARFSVVNVNTAGKKELMDIPGIGETYAERIMEYRNTNGKFVSIEDLSKVKGIGKKKLAKLRPFVRVQ